MPGFTFPSPSCKSSAVSSRCYTMPVFCARCFHFSEASRIYGSDRIDDIEDNSQLRRGRPGTSSPIHPVMSRLILCYSFVKLPTRYMAFHRPLIPPTTCTSWPFKKSLLSKRRETGPMTVETDYTPRAIWIRSSPVNTLLYNPWTRH